MANTVRVAAAQMTSVNDLAANFATCSRLAKEAASAGAKLLCFPENFAYVGVKQGDSTKIAEPLDGPIMNRYCSLARSHCHITFIKFSNTFWFIIDKLQNLHFFLIDNLHLYRIVQQRVITKFEKIEHSRCAKFFKIHKFRTNKKYCAFSSDALVDDFLPFFHPCDLVLEPIKDQC